MTKENKKIEEKVEQVEGNLDDKLEKIQKEFNRKISETRKETSGMVDEITSRVERMEMMIRKRIESEDEDRKRKKKEQEQRKVENENRKASEKAKKETQEKEAAQERNEKSLEEEINEIEDDAEENSSNWLDKQVNDNKGWKTWEEVQPEKEKVKSKERKKKGMKKIRSWFQDSDSESSEDSSEEEDDNQVWEDVNRIEKKKLKKERQIQRKEKLQKETATKASLTVGIGPVTKDTLRHFEDTEKDTKKAEEAAVKEFLGFYLKYGDNELEKLEIKATQVAPKEDMIYVAFADKKDVQDIYSRAARCRNEEVSTRNFIPPQFFERYMFLSRKCADARKESGNTLKTQMRFNKHDVEVLTKVKGSEEGYKKIDLSEICDADDIPSFDASIKWRKKNHKTTPREAE